MKRCWNAIGRDRPSFPECRKLIGTCLQSQSDQAFQTLQELLDSFHKHENVDNDSGEDDSSTSLLLPNFGEVV